MEYYIEDYTDVWALYYEGRITTSELERVEAFLRDKAHGWPFLYNRGTGGCTVFVEEML